MTLDESCEVERSESLSGQKAGTGIHMVESAAARIAAVRRTGSIMEYGRHSVPAQPVLGALCVYEELCFRRARRLADGNLRHVTDSELLPAMEDETAWLRNSSLRHSDPAADAANSLLGWYDAVQTLARADAHGIDSLWVARVGAYDQRIGVAAVQWSQNALRRAHELLFVHVYPDFRTTDVASHLWGAVRSRMGRGEKIRWDVAACMAHSIAADGIYACVLLWNFVPVTLEAQQYMQAVGDGREIAHTTLIRMSLVFEYVCGG